MTLNFTAIYYLDHLPVAGSFTMNTAGTQAFNYLSVAGNGRESRAVVCNFSSFIFCVHLAEETQLD